MSRKLKRRRIGLVNCFLKIWEMHLWDGASLIAIVLPFGQLLTVYYNEKAYVRLDEHQVCLLSCLSVCLSMIQWLLFMVVVCILAVTGSSKELFDSRNALTAL